MKQLFILLFISLCFSVKGQWPLIEFEQLFDTAYYQIDSGSIWQVGVPQKSVLNTAYQGTKVIITDTSATYPVNDTSSFIVIHHLNDYDPFYTGWGSYSGGMGGWLNIDSDTLSDYLLMELSFDNGANWIDIVNDTLLYDTLRAEFWHYGIASGTGKKLVTSGRTDGWIGFYVNSALLFDFYNVQNGDTLLYKFTFISDSIDNSRDGVMLDLIGLDDVYMSIDYSKYKNFKLDCYPNPAKTHVYFKFDNTSQTPHSLQIFDALGRAIYHQSNIQNDQFSVNTTGFDAGIYHYELKNEKNNKRSVGRFVISP